LFVAALSKEAQVKNGVRWANGAIRLRARITSSHRRSVIILVEDGHPIVFELFDRLTDIGKRPVF